MKQLRFVLFVGLLLCVASAVFAFRADEDASSRLYDADGNRIFDNLDAVLARAGSRDRVPVVVQFREETPLAGTYAVRLSGILQAQDIKYSYGNVPAVAARMSAREIRAALADPMVDHVELDGVLREAMTTASSAFGVTQARNQFHYTGDGDGKPTVYGTQDVVIAIIDTGIQPSHPDLRGKVLYFKDYVNHRTQPYDDEGHGTHVAGVAAGAGRLNKSLAGVAPGAALVVFKVLGADGSGSLSDGIAAVDETISRKAQFNIRVLNLSLAVSGSFNGRDALSLACNRAVAAGIVTVVAAGNDGPGSRTIGSPSAAANVITVGAGADPAERGFYIADFSGRGPTADGRIKPDLWAPGVRLRSPDMRGGYSDVSGTSFSAPFVSGVVALMLDAKPTLTPAAVKTILMATAVRWAPGAKSNEAGAGRLQAYQAIARAALITVNLQPPVVPRVRFVQSTLANGQELTYAVNVLSTKFPLAVSLVKFNYPSVSTVLEVLSPSGAVLGHSESLTRQELVKILPLTPGTYTVRISASGSATGFLLDISADQ